MNKIFQFVLKIFKGIYRILDRFFVTPISRFLFRLNDRLKNNPSKIEHFLNRPNILLYISLIFAVGVFFLIDSQVVTLVEKEAEILSN